MVIEDFEEESEAEGSGGEDDIRELRAKKLALARKIAEQQRREEKIQVGPAVRLDSVGVAQRTHSDRLSPCAGWHYLTVCLFSTHCMSDDCSRHPAEPWRRAGSAQTFR